MKVAIVTFHRAHSCGAMLQAWALRTVLSRMGHDVVFPNCNSVGDDRELPSVAYPGAGSAYRRIKMWFRAQADARGARTIFPEVLSRYDAFRRRWLPEADVAPAEFQGAFDAAVFGSDQIWNGSITGNMSDYFTGRFLPDGFRSIAYAASAGDHHIPQGEELCELASDCRRFLSVSVREQSLADALAPHVGMDIPVLLDPTLLLDMNDYACLSTPCHPSSRYLYVYSLEYNFKMLEMAMDIARLNGLELVYTPLYQYTDNKMPRGLSYAVSPDRFLDLIMNSECVLTDSFHGLAFSARCRKPFVVCRFGQDGVESRPACLLRQLGMSGRLVRISLSDTSFGFVSEALESPFPDDMSERLERLRLRSRGWLAAALRQEVDR